MSQERDQHAQNSVLREVILEHLFVGHLLRLYWRRGEFDVEVLRSEFDAGGYDLIVARGELVRHVQLKAKRAGGSTASYNLSLQLAKRPSGCALLMEVDDALTVIGYRYFGGKPGEPLPDIQDYPVARHVRGNAEGIKGERPGLRRVPLSKFRALPDLEGVAEALLGQSAGPLTPIS